MSVFLVKLSRYKKKKLTIEDKPEIKKAGGVFYTPSYVVEFIVSETVNSILIGKTPKQVEKVKILDPACGSGSFLIVAYQHLLDWHLDFYISNGGLSKFKKELHQIEKGKLRLTTQVRKSILLNNIFGVDIDSQAVEVTKLALLLKVLEGESGETLGKNLSLFRERALPDLGSNIKCGNSLILNNFYDQGKLPVLTESDHYRVNAFEWKDEFGNIFKSSGFDAVIGNLPYGATLYPLEKTYIQSHYSHQSYQLDSYLLFMEISILCLLKKGGLWGMIVPNPWLSNLKQAKLRHLVMGSTCIKKIIHFRYPVFKKAIVDTEVIIFKNGFSKKTQVKVFNVPREPVGHLLEGADVVVASQDDWLKSADLPINIFLSLKERMLREKIFTQSFVISDFLKVNVGIKPYQVGKGKPAQTKENVKERIFDSKWKKSAQYRQYVRGKDITRYEIRPLEQRFLKYGMWLAEPRPAANFDAKVKILVRQTGDEIIAALDTAQYLCLNNLHVLEPRDDTVDTYAILALLNSKLATWCLRTMNPETGEALAEVKKEFVEMLPVPDRAKWSKLSSLGREMTTLKANAPSMVNEKQQRILTSKIDIVIAEAFDLTSAEMTILEF